jgi:cytochrome c
MKRLVALTAAATIVTAHAAGDAPRGARVFHQCMACHSVVPGENLTGPSLAHIWNRPAASATDFQRYSDALRKSGLVWNAATLDKWLAGPEKLVPGTSMTFPGIKDTAQRQDVIAYLQAVSEGKAPQQTQGAMRGMQRPKLDLKTAPPEGQVIAVKYCGDTYTIDTADGKSQKVWEFNLRIKTDSTKLGPLPGKPVVIGAGMQGDRAQLVFARPAEIGEFIKASCP